MRTLQIKDEGDLFVRVCDFITDGRWDISAEFSVAFLDIADNIRKVPLPLRNVEDTLIWPYSTTSDLSFRDVY